MTMERRHRWLALIVLCIGDLMIVLDATIVNVALPSIQDDLGFSEASLAWVVNAYLLTFGGFMLLGGRLGDLFGHRRLFLIGHRASSPLASLACGLAESQATLVVARGVQGLGGAIVAAVALVADHDALHRAGRAREGDGRVRLRRRGRRQRRRAPRRRAHRRARAGTGSSSSTCRSASPSSSPACAVLPAGRLAGASRPARRRRRGDDHRRAHARGLRDRERQRGGLGLGADARPARPRPRCSASPSS